MSRNVGFRLDDLFQPAVAESPPLRRRAVRLRRGADRRRRHEFLEPLRDRLVTAADDLLEERAQFGLPEGEREDIRPHPSHGAVPVDLDHVDMHLREYVPYRGLALVVSRQ